MQQPHRFQRSRKKGWGKPPGGVICDKTSRWGNKLFDWRILGRAEAKRLYKAALIEGRLPFTVEDVRRELRGHPLGCWCPLDEPCHVDVLLEIANGPE
jgi:Domain of unknown function (DUF4326)